MPSGRITNDDGTPKKSEYGWKASTLDDDKDKNKYLHRGDQVTISLASADFTASAKYSVKVVLGESLELFIGGKITVEAGLFFKLVMPGVFIENTIGWQWGFGATGLTLLLGLFRKQHVMDLKKAERTIRVFTQATVSNHATKVDDLEREAQGVITDTELDGVRQRIDANDREVTAHVTDLTPMTQRVTARANATAAAATEATGATSRIVATATETAGSARTTLASMTELANASTTIAQNDFHAAGLHMIN